MRRDRAIDRRRQPVDDRAGAVWELHVRGVLPAAGRVLDGGWREVGDFLGGSIRDWYASWPLARQLEAWRDAGIDELRTVTLSFGAGLAIWGRRL